LLYSAVVRAHMLPGDLVKRTNVTGLESIGRTEIKAVRSIEMRGMISTSSSAATSSSSGGVIEFRNETGNAMVCEVAKGCVRVR
jgi:hypothetical protein